jgi:hypothetical protein
VSRALLCWLVAAFTVLGCRSPTQITLAISTDLDCSARLVTSISEGLPEEVAHVAPATTTAQCAGAGEIGTLVFVPSHARDDRIAVQVVTAVGVPLESCRPPAFGKDCIVATRSLHYIPHASLTLPIVMRNACRGIVCPDGQTCSKSVCVSAEIDPSTCTEPAGCAEPGPIDASAPPPVDGGVVDAGDAAVLPVVDGAAPPETVASGRRSIASITSDSTSVYWTEAGDYPMANGGVYRTAGGAVTTIASGRVSPSFVVVDATSVFWAELLGEGIVRAPIGGGPATALPIAGTVGANMTVIGVDDTFVYWNNESVGASQGTIRRVLKDGTGTQTVASKIAEGPWTMAVSGTSVAFVSVARFGGTGQVVTVPKAGGMPAVVSALKGSYASARVAMSGTRIAWATTDNGGSVMASTGTGVVTTLATGQGDIASLAATPTAVYWVHGPSGSAGSLARASWSAGAQRLFEGIAVPGPLTVSSTHVYFVDNRMGEIKRVPK